MTPEPNPEARFVPLRMEMHHADDKSLKPEDCPVQVQQRNIVKNDGNAIAEACDEKTVEDVADRLNAEEYRREEDRWSA
jgi:hypothetical protein